MFLFFIFGVLLLITSILVFKYVPADEGGKIYGIIPIVLAVIFILSSVIFVVPAGHVGVPVLFGDVQQYTYSQGLNFKPPWLSIHRFEIRMQEYSVTAQHGEGEYVGAADDVDVLTRDGLRVEIDATVQWRIDPVHAWWIYQDIGRDMDQVIVKVVRPSIRGATRDQGGKYSSTQLYTVGRTEYRHDVIEDLFARFAQHGLILDDFILRNIKLPTSVERAIEEKQATEQMIETKRNQVRVAEEEANRKIEEARGIAGAQTIIQDTLTNEYLTWYYITTLHDLVDSPNNSVIVMPFDQNLIPMITLPGGQ